MKIFLHSHTHFLNWFQPPATRFLCKYVNKSLGIKTIITKNWLESHFDEDLSFEELLERTHLFNGEQISTKFLCYIIFVASSSGFTITFIPWNAQAASCQQLLAPASQNSVVSDSLWQLGRCRQVQKAHADQIHLAPASLQRTDVCTQNDGDCIAAAFLSKLLAALKHEF